MKKNLLLIILISSFLYAKDTCYSVQLLSRIDNGKTTKIDLQGYPHDCTVMKIGDSLTLRCGCFDIFENAQKRLKTLQVNHKKAMLVTTFKYRFKKQKGTSNYVEKGILESLSSEKKSLHVKEKQSTNTTSKQTAKKEVCYSVQIKSATKSQSSLNTLLHVDYPYGCKVMEFSNSFAVRCGCYDDFSQVQKKYKSLKKEYRNAQLANTYKYRFENGHEVAKVYTKKQKVTNSDQELRLILQVFLYKSDLKSAYKVADIGVHTYPNSYYWNQKMAQVAQWNNKLAQSMQYLKKAYALSANPDIEDKLIDYGTASFQYEEIEPLVVSRLKRDHSEKNINLMIFVYKKIGVPEKILTILDEEYKQDPKNTLFLTKALQISLEMGSLEDAQRYVRLIESHEPYSKEDAALLARYYYIKRDIPKSYDVLLHARKDDNEKFEHIIKFYELKSDLGWYLQKNLEAAEASKELMKRDKARLVDYERISFVYKESNPTLAVKAVRDGFKKYHLSYLFYSYANDAINMQKFDELRDLMKQVSKDNPAFSKEALFWIIKAKVYGHYKLRDKEEEALLKALELAPNSYQVKVSLLWHFVDISDNYKLKILLMNLEEDDKLDESLYFPMASAYFYLNNINRASYYTQKILYSGSQTADMKEFKFLQASIYQLQNKEDAYKRLIREITQTMKKNAQENPRLWENPQFLSIYLRAVMNVMENKKFEKLLKKYKHFLHRQDYNEISYSYALKIHAIDKSRKIYNKTKHKEIWLQFSNVLLFTNHSKIENMLSQYLATLSTGDAIVSAQDDGQIALAQSLNFEAYDKNSYSQNLYVQQLDLVKKRNGLFNAKISFYNRNPLLQKYFTMKNQNYIEDGLYLYTGFSYFINSSLNLSTLVNVPRTTSEALVGLKQVYEKGYIGLDVSYHDNLATYLSYSLYGSYNITDRITLNLLLGKAVNTSESTQLYLAGKKDTITPHFQYRIVPSTLIDIDYEHNKYYSSDDVYIGRGDYARFIVSKIFKSGYPDINIGLYYDRGLYQELDTKKGVLDTLQVKKTNILPRDFYNYGLNFSYGMINSDIYTRVWRGFFETSISYNSDIENYTYSINCGMGGKVYHQDHLVIGANYTESVNGIGGTIFEIYLNYKFLYHLPR